MCTESVLEHVRTVRIEETPAVPGVGLPQRIVPPSILRRDVRASEENPPTSCSNLVIPGVSEVEQCSPRGVKLQHALHISLVISQAAQAPRPDSSLMSEAFIPSFAILQLGAPLPQNPDCQSASRRRASS